MSALRPDHEAGEIYTRALEAAARAFSSGSTPNGEAWERLKEAALAYAEAAGKPLARTMHEAGAATLWERLGFPPASSPEPLRTIAEWFNGRVRIIA